MTNHTGHAHPATPAGRAACRKAMAKADTINTPFDVAVRYYVANVTEMNKDFMSDAHKLVRRYFRDAVRSYARSEGITVTQASANVTIAGQRVITDTTI